MAPEARIATPPDVLDRPFVGKFTLEQVVYIVVFLIAVFLRTYELGVRPYHHDESIHAFFSWKILENGLGDYKYDPVYHGPLLYYSSALMMWLFGDNDFTGRLSAVVFGLGVVAFAWPLRRYLGRWGALAFLVLVTFSPSWTYFTRFVRHDIYLALCNLGAVFFAFRYGETRARQAPVPERRRHRLRLLQQGGHVPHHAAVPRRLRGDDAVGRAARRADAAAGDRRDHLVPAPQHAADPHLAGHLRQHLGAALHLVRLPPGEVVRGAARRSTYWIGQQQIKRIGGPWYYYVPELVLYEPLITFPALAAMIGAITQKPAPDRFMRFLVVWGVGSLFIYAWAQEKVPWLLDPAAPAADAAQRALVRPRHRDRRARAAGAGAGARRRWRR